MSFAWFWYNSNWLMCFLFSTSQLLIFSFQLCPPFHAKLHPICQSVAVTGPFGNSPFYISRLPPHHHLKIAESPLLPAPSRRVFLGILRKTLGVDPGMTPCPVPGLWGTSQLGFKPVLAVSRMLVVFETGSPDHRTRRTVRESYTATKQGRETRG